MWFRVVFYENMQPIAAAVGDDDVYFKANDVGRMLGYANPYGFANRYGVTDFNTKLPPQMKTKDASKKCFVFTFSEMMALIQQKKHRLQIALNVNDMIELWVDGSVDTTVPMKPSLDFRYSPVLHLGRNKKFKMQSWILSYKRLLDESLKRLNDYLYYEQPPSVITQDDSRINDFTMFEQQDPRLNVSDDPRNVSDDPRNVSDDPRLNVSDDPRLNISDDPRNEQPKISNQETIDAVTHLPEDPEQLYNLNMNFDAFPPDQIFINIYDKSFKYVYDGLK